jgi:hypothetical protein
MLAPYCISRMTVLGLDYYGGYSPALSEYVWLHGDGSGGDQTAIRAVA